MTDKQLALVYGILVGIATGILMLGLWPLIGEWAVVVCFFYALVLIMVRAAPKDAIREWTRK